MPVPELVRAYPEPDQEILAQLRSGQMSHEEMRAMAPPEKRPFRIPLELQAAKLTRAVLSERRLEEAMTDFWLNHFNVDARKDAVRWMVADYERTAIRPHPLGEFPDLLLATAHQPTILFDLDNWMFTKANFVPGAGPARGRRLGINESNEKRQLALKLSEFPHFAEVAGRHLGVTATAPLFPGFPMNPLKFPGVLV